MRLQKGKNGIALAETILLAVFCERKAETKRQFA
jgi:hypothetical protein